MKILKINIDAEIGSGKIKIRTRTESDVESRLNSNIKFSTGCLVNVLQLIKDPVSAGSFCGTVAIKNDLNFY